MQFGTKEQSERTDTSELDGLTSSLTRSPFFTDKDIRSQPTTTTQKTRNVPNQFVKNNSIFFDL